MIRRHLHADRPLRQLAALSIAAATDIYVLRFINMKFTQRKTFSEKIALLALKIKKLQSFK